MSVIAARALTLVMVLGLLGSCQQSLAAAPFPSIDRDKLRITLTRSGCFGTCPDYKVTIAGNGHVVFTTRDDSLPGPAEVHRAYSASANVVAAGRHEDDIDPRAVDALVQQFRDISFFALRNEYSAAITDNPTYALEIDTGHGRKQVIDYVGRKAGMPESVSKLEDAVDAASGSGRWVEGDDGLVAALDEEGFDFRSENAAVMLLAAIERGGDSTLTGLVDRGVPLEKSADGSAYGSRAILAAIAAGRVPLFQKLAAEGWLKRTSQSEIADAFASNAAGCNPAMVDAAVQAGIPVDATSASQAGELQDAQTALASVTTSYACDRGGNPVAVARRLIAHGADPNKRDGKGETAIFDVESPALLDFLLASGADARATDNQGYSAVFGSWTDAIVLRLLQAGASPRGRYYDGKSLLEEMRERPMPKTKAWLDAHPRVMAQAKAT